MTRSNDEFWNDFNQQTAARRLARERALAERAGYYVREGERDLHYDRRGRWYVGRSCNGFFPNGDGYPSPENAWSAAARAVRGT